LGARKYPPSFFNHRFIVPIGLQYKLLFLAAENRKKEMATEPLGYAKRASQKQGYITQFSNVARMNVRRQLITGGWDSLTKRSFADFILRPSKTRADVLAEWRSCAGNYG